jgi:hypothetical protein
MQRPPPSRIAGFRLSLPDARSPRRGLQSAPRDRETGKSASRGKGQLRRRDNSKDERNGFAASSLVILHKITMILAPYLDRVAASGEFVRFSKASTLQFLPPCSFSHRRVRPRHSIKGTTDAPALTHPTAMSTPLPPPPKRTVVASRKPDLPYSSTAPPTNETWKAWSKRKGTGWGKTAYEKVSRRPKLAPREVFC